MIKQYVQGTQKSDSELFSKIGHWIVDEAVQELMGNAITAKDQDIWLVASDDGKATGFLEARPMKNDSAHIRFCYAPTATVRNQLVKEFIKIAKELKLEQVYTNDRATATFWADLGFKKRARASGTFRRWDKEI